MLKIRARLKCGAPASGGCHHVVIHHAVRYYFQHLSPLVFSAFAPHREVEKTWMFGPSRPMNTI